MKNLSRCIGQLSIRKYWKNNDQQCTLVFNVNIYCWKIQLLLQLKRYNCLQWKM